MLEFHELNEENACSLCHCYKNSPYRISDYSIGIKRMWQDLLHPAFAIVFDCLIVKTTVLGRTVFDFPLPLNETANVATALLAVSAWCADNFVPLEFVNVPEEERERLVSLFPLCEFSYRRELSDYLYEAEALRTMSGRNYAAQRNHIKRFHTNYPGAQFRAFTADDVDAIKAFLRRFSSGYSKPARGAKSELARAEHMIRRVGSSCFYSGGFVLDGEILSFCLSERCGDMLIDHIEKALPEFEGIYPATVKAFLETFSHGITFFNREDDAADRGLRMSKLQYRPCAIVHKYTVKVKNELSRLRRIPRIFSERLVLDAITADDAKAYHRLCTDKERNRYWEEPDAPPSVPTAGDEGYYYRDQRSDFVSRTAINFAIRREGILIGEVILYRFNGRGEAEVGLRLLRDYDGFGYGREALSTAISFALYTLGLSAVRSKCYRENQSSFHMLSSVMRRTGEDETFLYFVSTF